jgi:hypothetical protein
MYAFGNMHEKCAWSGKAEMQQLVNQVLENYIHPQLDSQYPSGRAK